MKIRENSHVCCPHCGGEYTKIQKLYVAYWYIDEEGDTSHCDTEDWNGNYYCHNCNEEYADDLITYGEWLAINREKQIDTIIN